MRSEMRTRGILLVPLLMLMGKLTLAKPGELQRPRMPVEPVRLIIDTDIGGGGCRDVDDVGAICLAHALADRGEARLLAIVQNTNCSQCTGVISVLNHYYGRDAVPIGAYMGTDQKDDIALSYVADLIARWPSPVKNTSQVPDILPATDRYGI